VLFLTEKSLFHRYKLTRKDVLCLKLLKPGTIPTDEWIKIAAPEYIKQKIRLDIEQWTV